MDQNIGAFFTSEATLQLPPYPKSSAELPAPYILILLFHLMAGDLAFQKGVHTPERYLAAMQGHAHSVAGERRDHPGSVPKEKDMIFHPGPTFKTDLRNCQRLLV